ncbi:MAG TPA: hypothetical protein VKN35_13680, partial [Xanthomonadales bacterium]|nr:hypothetical protein [Xanthomonadales bacterium]
EIEGLVEESFEIELELKLKQGQLDVTALALDTGKDRIEVPGDAGSWPGFHGASIKFDISTEDYGRWEPLLSRQPKPAGPLSASGQVDSSDAGAVSITAQLTQQGNELSLDGSLGNLPLPDQPDLNFNLSAQSFLALGAVFDQTAWPEAAFKAKGRASRNEQGVVLEKVTASLADNEAELDGILILAEDFEGSNFELTLDIPSTTAFGELMGYAKLPDQPLRLSANVKPVGKGLKFSVKDGSLRGIKVKLDGEIPDVHHPALFSADADVRMPSLGLLGFLVPGTRLPDLPVAINGRVSHESGNAQLSDIHLEIGKSVADLSGNLNVSNGLVGSKLSVNASGSDFTEFLPVEAWNSLPGDFKVSGQWSKAADNEYLENIRIQVGKMTVEVSGTSDNMFKPQMARLKLKADFPDASMFNALFDWTLAPQPFLLNTDLAGSLTDFDLTNLAASLGQSNLTGELKIVRNEDVNVSGSLKSEFLDLGQWLKDKEQLKKADGTTDSAPKTRVFDDSLVMKFDAGNTDLDLDIQIAKADMGNTVFENIHLGVLVTDKRLKLDPFDFMGQQGSHVDGSFSLDGRGPVPELEITAHGQDLRLGLMAYEGQDPSTFPPFEISATIKGAGATQQALVSDLDGKIRIYQGSGVVASSGVEFLFSDFITQLFSMLNPFAKQNKETQIECGVLAADIVDGQVSIKPIVVQTSDITI